MERPSEGLEERLREVDSYLGFLRSIEKATMSLGWSARKSR